MLVVRPALLSDFEAFRELAHAAGPGFTSLMVPDDRLLKKLKVSEESFAASVTEPGHEAYLLMLEDSDNGRVVGVSGIKAKTGQSGPYFSYRLLRQTQASKAVDRQFDMDMMVLVNDYSGASEIGTLFVKSEMRGTGAGKLISQARYMVMAAAPHRFNQSIISELRGHIEPDGSSVFWDAVGRPFFHMDFGEADEISARTDNEFIVDLMPKHPIYVDLLPEEARNVIGKVHPSGIGAKRLLEAEGFVYERMIDIFDGGPSMHVQRDSIRTVRESVRLEAKAGTPVSEGWALVSNDKADGFRCVHSVCDFSDRAVLPKETLNALNIKAGDSVRVWKKS